MCQGDLHPGPTLAPISSILAQYRPRSIFELPLVQIQPDDICTLVVNGDGNETVLVETINHLATEAPRLIKGGHLLWRAWR